MNHAERKKLHHGVPFKILPDHCVFFLTICGEPRGRNQFANNDGFDALVQAVDHYNQAKKWWTYLLLAMPDHLHLLTHIPESNTLNQVISPWKWYLSRNDKINWQRNYFDHRLRSEESWRQKADYILANPVRAKLVDHPEKWPYVWLP